MDDASKRVSGMRTTYEAMHRAWPHNKLVEFMLEHGRDYTIGPATFAGPRDEPGRCYMNAALLALRFDHLTYVEGMVAVYGVPISHAWCVDASDVVLDTTLDRSMVDGKFDRISDYFGVPFRTDYLRAAA